MDFWSSCWNWKAIEFEALREWEEFRVRSPFSRQNGHSQNSNPFFCQKMALLDNSCTDLNLRLAFNEKQYF